MHKSHSFVRTTTTLSIAAAVMYSSWPLGYWLNPAASRASLASGLGAAGQPYNWLFIGLDVTSSLLMVYVAYVSWKKYRDQPCFRPLAIILVSVALFGIGTSVDALLPERCVPGLQQCQSFRVDHLLLIHGIFSIAASVALFVGLVVAWLRQRSNLLLGSLLYGYAIFGLVSLIEATLPGHIGNWSQHYYITLCSIWLAAVPYTLALLSRPTTPVQNEE